ncbi:hypothetical protein E4U43_006268, partial [Claviceps pusilla]
MTSSRAWNLWNHDEEMAKKSDDPPMPGYSKHRASASGSWTAARVPRRSWVKRIIVYVLIAAALFFLFFRRHGQSSLPSEPTSPYTRTRSWDRYDSIERAYQERFGPGTGTRPRQVGNDASRPDSSDDSSSSPPPTKGGTKAAAGKHSIHQPSSAENPSGKNPKAVGNADSGGSSLNPRPKYEGPLRFTALSSTLQAISATRGILPKNRNVLFAAASLKSVSTLLPMACKMATERQNYVHFAYMGLADITIKELLEMNGADKDCEIVTHDGRPDHFESSTEHRMRLAITTALYHINTYMHPQAVILDSTTAEENYFLASARNQILSTPSALIELPNRPEKSLAWISKLDSSALS